jgi:TolA-binding protein
MLAARVGLAAAAVAMLASSSVARANSEARLDCPSIASEQKIEALENQLDALDEKLDAMQDQIDQLADVRREALDEAKDRIETLVHDSGLSQERMDAEVAKALAQAEAKGVAAAKAAQALHRSMIEVKTRMAALRQQMHTMAGRRVDKDPDAG